MAVVKRSDKIHHGADPQVFGPSTVDGSGYLSNKEQVDRLLAAGRLSDDWLSAHFSEPAEVPDDYRPPNYAMDKIDLVEMSRDVLRGLSEAEAITKAMGDPEDKLSDKTMNREPAVEPEPAPAPE